MARPVAKYPKPKMRYRYGGWEIYWNSKGRYTLFTGIPEEEEQTAENALRRVAVALAMPEPAFPPEYADAPDVVRYLQERCNIAKEEPPASIFASEEEMLAAYEQNLLKYCDHDWAVTSYNVIEAVHAFVPGGVLKMTHALALQYLESILGRGKKPATRNSHKAICSRFYKWCVENGILPDSPFTGIKRMRVPDIEEVVYCTKTERDRVLAAAKASGRRDWFAVAIAFYAGCRREEVFRLQWQDINFSARRLVVRVSKTGRKRTTPIARELLEILEAVRKERGPVVPHMPGEGWENQADRLMELCRERLCRPLMPGYFGQPCEAVGKRRFAATEDAIAAGVKADGERLDELRKTFKTMKRGDPEEKKTIVEIVCMENVPAQAYDGQPWLPAERVGWNAWRHTFATLRAQAGVSLDKISSWMGNSYDVCKKHYTQFMPRGEHEEDIDK